MDYVHKSARLGFRLFYENDAESFYNNHNEEKFMHWFPGNECDDIEDALETMEDHNYCVNNTTLPYVLAVELLETNELIGDVGVSKYFMNNKEIEIGFSICEKYQGLGYATEAVESMSKYFMSVFSKKNLYGVVLHGNEASCKILQKCGFIYKSTEIGSDYDDYGNGLLIYIRTE